MSNVINEIKEIKEDSSYPQDIALYKKIRVIGHGSFGFLYETIITSGKHKDESVAVKEIKLSNLNEKTRENFNVRSIK